jgi:hypothetical protein
MLGPNVKMLTAVFPKLSLLADSFWLRKITKDPHILADVNTGYPEDMYPKLKIYSWELLLHIYENIPVTLRNNALCDMNLIPMLITRLHVYRMFLN